MIKTIQFTLTLDEYEEVMRIKKDKSWRDLILDYTKNSKGEDTKINNNTPSVNTEGTNRVE